MSKRDQKSKSDKQTQNQGEGDRESAQRYNEQTRKFVESGKVDEAAEKAGKQSKEVSRKAEKAGKSRAKELDPEVPRDYSKPAENE